MAADALARSLARSETPSLLLRSTARCWRLPLGSCVGGSAAPGHPSWPGHGGWSAAAFAVALLPIPAVPLALLPTERGAARSAETTQSSAMPAAACDAVSEPAPAAPPAAQSPLSWPVALVSLWALAVAVHAAFLWAAYVRTRRIVRGSTPACGESLSAAAFIAAHVGLKRVPDVRCSPDVASPQTVGARRPLVLLPAAADAALSTSEREIVLA